MSLRLLLLLIGVCLIVVIYLREVMLRKKAAKRHAEVVFDHEPKSSDEIPAISRDADDDTPGQEEIRLTRPDRNENRDKIEGMFDFSISARGATPEVDEEQIPLVLHDVIESDDKPVSPADEKRSDPDSSTPGEDDILMLVIAPADDNTFRGLDILSATKAAGMKFGKMNIFHNYGVGDMNLDKPLFSLANLYEPGEFDLQEMESFSTRGLVIYMCLPTPVGPEIALELMLNTAQRIADHLDAVVCDHTRQPLRDEAFEDMRDKLQRFHH